MGGGNEIEGAPGWAKSSVWRRIGRLGSMAEPGAPVRIVGTAGR
jgi:hypothetical protein